MIRDQNRPSILDNGVLVSKSIKSLADHFFKILHKNLYPLAEFTTILKIKTKMRREDQINLKRKYYGKSKIQKPIDRSSFPP